MNTKKKGFSPIYMILWAGLLMTIIICFCLMGDDPVAALESFSGLVVIAAGVFIYGIISQVIFVLFKKNEDVYGLRDFFRPISSPEPSSLNTAKNVKTGEQGTEKWPGSNEAGSR